MLKIKNKIIRNLTRLPLRIVRKNLPYHQSASSELFETATPRARIAARVKKPTCAFHQNNRVFGAETVIYLYFFIILTITSTTEKL